MKLILSKSFLKNSNIFLKKRKNRKSKSGRKKKRAKKQDAEPDRGSRRRQGLEEGGRPDADNLNANANVNFAQNKAGSSSDTTIYKGAVKKASAGRNSLNKEDGVKK